MGIVGIAGRPYVDLGAHLDLRGLDALHDEVCLALAQLPVDYTGGSHRTMDIMPPSRRDEALVDYGEVLAGLDDAAFEVFRRLADDPASVDPRARWRGEFGEERRHPLSRRQMLFLKYRHRVYFPWKVYYELMPNRLWTEKSRRGEKAFTREARAFFPKTLAFVERLPFVEIGRVNVMGLEAHDHGTVHRDADPEVEPPSHFVTFCPAPGKRLFLWDEDARRKLALPPEVRAYWFNDGDYHGVEADPFFRYSIRVDGVFREDFIAQVTAVR